MRIFTKLGLFLGFVSTAFAGSVVLVNDTHSKLTAVIRAADGSDIGKLDINPQQTMTWTNYFGGTGNIQYYDVSQTPYTVLWFCNTDESSSEPFSVCTGVSSGSTITAYSCDGTKTCPLPSKKQKGAQPGSYGAPNPGPTPPAPTPQQQIQQQTEQEAGPPEGMLQ
ncbi:MAG: hypothetical protein JSS10_04225 [Verrucomicrobia bacterium]|nr:hypothetical protein [Verrucomicrobiota bacterium]